MNRCDVFIGILLAILGAASLASTSVNAQDENWTASDTEMESRADQLAAKGQNEAAEAIYRQLCALHPHSSVALVLHIGILDTMGRFTEALAESRQAVEIDPENFAAQRWLGISLSRLGQYIPAIAPLEMSAKLDPYNNGASIWLANAYFQIGESQRSNQILERLLQDHPKEEQSDTMSWIANVYYNIGDSYSAVLWWKRSAILGNKQAAQWLSWAYSTGYGVPEDQGDSAYWSRRGDDPFPWFPRLSIADSLIKWANGWGLVLIMLFAAMLLPVVTIGGVGCCVSRGLTTDPSVHWTERARRSYPFQVFLGFCLLILPIVYAAGSECYPGSALPVPKWLFLLAVFATALIASNAITVRLTRFYRDKPDSALQNLQKLFIGLFRIAPTFAIFILMLVNLPAKWNLQAFLVITAAVIAYFWIQFGGWIRLARLIRILVPANGEIVDDAASLARQWGRPPPTILMFRWHQANALAFIFSNTIAVTEKLHAILSRDEMNAILAHELAHLYEDRITRYVRLLAPLLILLPLFTVSLWLPVGGWWCLIICYAGVFLGSFLLRKLSRKMEVRADTLGKEAEKESGAYPQALAKLYEANFVPAVMPGKRQVHPHLYDRLLAAGITPEYPRPKPPGRWGIRAAFFTIALNLVCLATTWLLLF